MQSNMNLCIGVYRHGKIFFVRGGLRVFFFILFCEAIRFYSICYNTVGYGHPVTMIKRQENKLISLIKEITKFYDIF